MSTGNVPVPAASLPVASNDLVREAWGIVRSMLSPREPISARELESRLEKVDALLTRAVGGPTDPNAP